MKEQLENKLSNVKYYAKKTGIYTLGYSILFLTGIGAGLVYLDISKENKEYYSFKKKAEYIQKEFHILKEPTIRQYFEYQEISEELNKKQKRHEENSIINPLGSLIAIVMFPTFGGLIINIGYDLKKPEKKKDAPVKE